ncbi:hypothetical protein PIB30_065108 [Stylosanthes scabra]|uniref:Uncharacterized protein n=1 Tax=Stylosanthes scabra TaxID=79078 RepID=A0ABU6XMT8_9FABA|nr:hypothetical protein [Stylosanthes scabra]
MNSNSLTPPNPISLPKPQPCSAVPVGPVADRTRRRRPHCSPKSSSSPPPAPPLKSHFSPHTPVRRFLFSSRPPSPSPLPALVPVLVAAASSFVRVGSCSLRRHLLLCSRWFLFSSPPPPMLAKASPPCLPFSSRCPSLLHRLTSVASCRTSFVPPLRLENFYYRLLLMMSKKRKKGVGHCIDKSSVCREEEGRRNMGMQGLW